jgi:hypothetical protein
MDNNLFVISEESMSHVETETMNIREMPTLSALSSNKFSQTITKEHKLPLSELVEIDEKPTG